MEKYKAEERMLIGKSIYDGTYTVASAAEAFHVSFYTARNYLREYKAHLTVHKSSSCSEKESPLPADETRRELLKKRYERMDKSELIDELIKEKCR